LINCHNRRWHYIELLPKVKDAFLTQNTLYLLNLIEILPKKAGVTAWVSPNQAGKL
jgi:hypothetical protein